MKVVYASRSGNVEKFVMKLGRNVDSMRIADGSEKVDDDFIIITYTDGVGSIPRQVETFLKANRDHLKAAAVSGNERRFPNTFAGAADKIAAMFDVPIIVTFDGEGGGDAVDDVVDFLEENS